MKFEKAANGTAYIYHENFKARFVVKKASPADRYGRKVWIARATVWNPLGAMTDWTSPQETRADAVTAAKEYIANGMYDYVPEGA